MNALKTSILLTFFWVVGCATQPGQRQDFVAGHTEGQCKQQSAMLAGKNGQRNCASIIDSLCGANLFETYLRDPSSLQYNVVIFEKWAEGDYQLNYEPDREVSEQKAEKFQNSSEFTIESLANLTTAGKGKEAEAAIKKYLRKNPNDKRAVFLLGVNHLRSKKKELAAFLFKELEKDSNFAWKSLVLNNLGMLALQDQNQSGAIDYFEKATKSEPLTPAPFVNLGALYLKSRSYAEAEALFSKAVQLDGDFEDAVAGWGSSLEGLGRFEEAHKVYARFIETHGNATTTLFNDAMILGTRLNSKEPAIRLMQKYLEVGGREKSRAQEMIQNWR